MQNTIKEKEAEFESALKKGEAQLRGAAANIEDKIKKGEDYVKSAISDVDRKLHENPWPVVSGVALGCLMLGFIMGASKKH